MGQTPEERKKQYIAVAIVIAVVVSATAMLIAFTQQQEEGALVNTNPLTQRPGSSTPTGPSAEPSQPAGQPGESAEISVSPSTSDAEGQVMVEGVGFEPDEKVTVTMENRALETEPSEVAADEEGRFSAEATVPGLPPGQYEVVATGEQGSSATQTVTVT